MSEEQKLEVEQPVEEQKLEVEQPVEEPVETKPKSPPKITVPPKKKEKDPKKVAQGKRLAQISERAKREKIRREIEEENQIGFSVNYRTLLYFGVPSIVFAGFYLYSKNKQVAAPDPGKNRAETKSNENPQPARKHVSLFD